jgi:lipoyl synthase
MASEPIDALLARAQALSWERFGKRVVLYLPGMFVIDGVRGRYPSISITGPACGLGCDHCSGKVLESMPAAHSPQELIDACLRLHDAGAEGFLITGGSDARGRLPWRRYLDALAEVKRRTALHLSVHAGMVDRSTATALKQTGVDQANMDIVGAEETWREVIHLTDGAALLDESLDALGAAGLDVVPHVVMGIHAGKLVGERRALEIVRRRPSRLLVWVVIMSLPGTPLAGAAPPPLEEAARLLCESRLLFPESEIALGCARPRGEYRRALERIALDAGVNRVALYSDETIDYARSLGLDVSFRRTCCSLPSAPSAAARAQEPSQIAIEGNR